MNDCEYVRYLCKDICIVTTLNCILQIVQGGKVCGCNLIHWKTFAVGW